MQNSKSLSYTDIGTGYPVLLGHSYLFDKTMWTPQIATLAESYRLIIPDLWGHGDSPELPESVNSLKDLAASHLALMDQLNISEFAVVGLSVGGMWGAELAALAPDRVKALMLFDTFVGSETPEAKENYFAMLAAVDAAGAIPAPILEHIVAQFYSDNASPDDVSALRTYLASLSAENLRHSIVPLGRLIFGRPDRMSILDDITCPVHVATGALDLPRPPAEGQLMAERLECEFTLIPDAAHISNRENPQAVTDLIRDFLQKNLPLC